jgi:hypothetical protein
MTFICGKEYCASPRSGSVPCQPPNQNKHQETDPHMQCNARCIESFRPWSEYGRTQPKIDIACEPKALGGNCEDVKGISPHAMEVAEHCEIVRNERIVQRGQIRCNSNEPDRQKYPSGFKSLEPAHFSFSLPPAWLHSMGRTDFRIISGCKVAALSRPSAQSKQIVDSQIGVPIWSGNSYLPLRMRAHCRHWVLVCQPKLLVSRYRYTILGVP